MSDNIAIQFRINRKLYEQLENKRGAERPIPPLADIVRRLLEGALDAEASAKAPSSEEAVTSTAALTASAEYEDGIGKDKFSLTSRRSRKGRHSTVISD
jgi:hypothetical protein